MDSGTKKQIEFLARIIVSTDAAIAAMQSGDYVTGKQAARECIDLADAQLAAAIGQLH